MINKIISQNERDYKFSINRLEETLQIYSHLEMILNSKKWKPYWGEIKKIQDSVDGELRMWNELVGLYRSRT